MIATGPDLERPPDGIREELDVTVFVPCLNEEKRVILTLGTILAAMAEVKCRYEVIVVDDGSTDRTSIVVEEFKLQHPAMPLRLIRNPQNLGLARSFVDTAFAGRGRYYRLVCGDNVEPKESMIQVMKEVGTVDIIIPYYPVLPGKSRRRKAISRLYTRLVNLFSGYKIRYFNGCGLYRRYHVMRWAPYNYGFGFQADLITTLLDEGATYKEIPLVGSHLTKDGGSPLHLRNFLSTGHTLFEIFLRRIRREMFGRKMAKLKPTSAPTVL